MFETNLFCQNGHVQTCGLRGAGIKTTPVMKAIGPNRVSLMRVGSKPKPGVLNHLLKSLFKLSVAVLESCAQVMVGWKGKRINALGFLQSKKGIGPIHQLIIEQSQFRGLCSEPHLQHKVKGLHLNNTFLSKQDTKSASVTSSSRPHSTQCLYKLTQTDGSTSVTAPVPTSQPSSLRSSAVD